MKYARLKELEGKRKKYAMIGMILSIITSISIVSLIPAFAIRQNILAILLIVIGLITGAVAMVFCFKSDRYSEFVNDYIVIKVMDIISANGIDARNYDFFKESKITYRLIFKEIIDYKKLQSEIDCELEQMNAIADICIRVKLY